MAKPRTKGQRIRYARIACNLSQPQLAKAVGQISKTPVSKSLVSQWERDQVKNPTNDNMLAVQAVTGFALEWLVNGRGPQRVSLSKAAASIGTLDHARLGRALEAAMPDLEDPKGVASVVASLYELLADAPDVSGTVLARFASTLSQR